MNVNVQRVRRCLKEFDFKHLFIEELNWSVCDNIPLDLEIKDTSCRCTPFAEMAGMVVFLAIAQDGSIPPAAIRKAVEHEIRKQVHEHILIFIDGTKSKSIWQWVKHEQGKSPAVHDHEFHKHQPGDSLLQKLSGIAFDMAELDSNGTVSIIKVAQRVEVVFDVEKVTKRFYEEFKKEHDAFCKVLKGLQGQEEVDWYASVMLNRLMFIYFIQKKGFLDSDTNYLSNKLKSTKAQGTNTYYRKLLVPLFFEGFAKEEKERLPSIKALLGNVPYMNGGIFMPHKLEAQYGDKIMVADSAFERLFSFFDSYNWHLDYRPLRSDNEINPDVLGYIFEKYINQKQMGAYYTKEDITDYICKNTIIPYLFDKLESFRREELHPFPMHDVEPYIYQAVKQEEYLPTETEREHQARKKRYQQITEDFTAGKIANINDLITYNLDICQFAVDWAAAINNPVTLRAFYFECLKKITVLDPTVGSGAFLFASLNILERLYEICIDKLSELGGTKYPDFAEELKLIAQHPNRKYFVLKTIIINNLFGVDIMEEAVEICKLRLFLKLVAQVDDVSKIEPLPDIDFNIKSGNTLVGHTNVDEIRKISSSHLDLSGAMKGIEVKIQEVDRALSHFRAAQTRFGISAADLYVAKAEVKSKLGKIQDVLNRDLAAIYGARSLDQYINSYYPFHWFVEFHGIMKNGGFDVIIGNPPYVAYRDVKSQYRIMNYKTEDCGNLYGFVIERCTEIISKRGRFGMILPLSITFSEDFVSLRKLVECTFGQAWLSSYDNIPAALFTGVSQRCTIVINGPVSGNSVSLWTAPMYRWRAEYREFLLANVSFTLLSKWDLSTEIPKIASNLQLEVYMKLKGLKPISIMRYVYPDRSAPLRFGFSQSARNFISTFINDPPTLDAETLKIIASSKIGYLPSRNEKASNAMLALCAGELYFWYWLVRGDGFDVTMWIVSDYLRVLNSIPEEEYELISALGYHLNEHRFEALAFKKNAGKYVGNYCYRKFNRITRRSDLLLLMSLGFSLSHAADIIAYVQKVLSINESAGEKSIPSAVKAMFTAVPVKNKNEQALFRRIDDKLCRFFKLSDDQLSSLINSDIENAFIDYDE